MRGTEMTTAWCGARSRWPLSVAKRNALARADDEAGQLILREPKAAPPSGEGRGRQTGTLLSPVLEEKYRTLLSEPVRLCASTYSMIR